MAKRRKVKIVRVLFLLIILVFIIIALIFAGQIFFNYQSGQSRTDEVQALVDDTNTILDGILAQSYPSNLSAESFALLQEAARGEISQYISTLEGYIKDGVDESEYEKAIALANPSDNFQIIFDNITYYPQAVIDLYNDDHGNLEFAVHYPAQEPYLVAPKSISLADGVPKLAQTNISWAYFPYQESIIGIDGSLPTALATIISSIKNDNTITPYSVAQIINGIEQPNEEELTEEDLVLLWNEEGGYYYYGFDISANPAVDTVAQNYEVSFQDLGDNYEAVAAALNNGQLVLAQTIENPNVEEVGEDYIVLSGIDGDQVTVIDPTLPSSSGSSFSLSQLIDQHIVNAKAFY